MVDGEKEGIGGFRRFCLEHSGTIAVAALVAVLAILAFASPSIGQIEHEGLEGYAPIAESLPSSLACMVVVACVLWALPFGKIAESRREQGNPRNKRTRIVDIKPAAALVAVACLAASSAVYLAVKLIGSSFSSAALLSEMLGSAPTGGALVEPSLWVPASATLRFALFLSVCIATAFFEEGLFRVILQKSVEKSLIEKGADPCKAGLKAALAISAVFGILHVATAPLEGADPFQVAIQAAAKFAQGMMFGLVMTGLLKRTGSFSFIVALHACYDLVLFFPPALMFGVMPTTYLTGDPLDSLALAVAACALIPAAVGAVRVLSSGGACGGAVHGDV